MKGALPAGGGAERPPESALSRENLHYTWEKTANRRRAVLLVLVFIPTVIASCFMAKTLPHKGAAPLELLLVFFFGILYAWISIGFWASAAGFVALMRRNYRLITADVEEAVVEPGARTVVLMPIYNEKVDRTFAGMYTVYRSLELT
jgi:membrane glycosyltransferase